MFKTAVAEVILFISYSKSWYNFLVLMFHRAFFNSIIDKTPTHALFIQHYNSLAC